MIIEREIDRFRAIALSAPAAEVEATFVPEAGMVGSSLLHRGEELLGQRGGLASYAAHRSTMGIPLLHPWANRLAGRRFEVAGRQIDLDKAEPPPATDPNGLPIHGLLAAAPGWQVAEQEANGDGGSVLARFDFSADPGFLEAFPFPHELDLRVSLEGRRLSIETTVTATGNVAVPIALGYHPYFRLPGVARADWQIEIPVRERLLLDDRKLSTGKREASSIPAGPLGTRTFDDEFAAPAAGESFALAGGGRRIEVSFDCGFPYAQIYAPTDDDVIAIEPMTAPTNALATGGSDLPLIDPGDSYRAVFSITIH
jgi:aldose 1-epimerase